MRLHIEHTTTFEYDAPAREFVTEMRLRPTSDQRQECRDFRVTLDPAASLYSHRDSYGNVVHFFNNLATCRKREILATSTVDTSPRYGGATGGNDTLDLLAQHDFVGESRYVRLTPALTALAASVPAGVVGDPLRRAEIVCRYINARYTYEPGVTDVHSTSDDVIALERGVCQDFAHVALGICHTLGLPARYVSGYYFDNTADTMEGASHAWIEVYTGPAGGWVGLDPTHNSIWADERYIKIGVGRDYNDVPPVRGTYRGGAGEKMHVTVRISRAGV